MVFTHPGIPFVLTIGREITICNNLEQSLEAGFQQQIDCLALPLFHPRLQRNKESMNIETCPLAKADTLIDSEKWMRNVIGKLSQDINLDSQYSHINAKSKFFLKQELNYAIHLGVHAFIIPKPTLNCQNYARIVNKFLLQGTGSTKIWMRIPLSEDEPNAWDMFNSFRFKLENTSAFSVYLDIASDLPDEDIIKRWMAEDIRAATLSASIFMNDDAGNPKLSTKHESLLRRLFTLGVIIIIKAQTNSEDVSKYREYIVRLYKTQPKINEIDYIQYRVQDVLQQPLQPLRDNLESQLYAHFEKDEKKYVCYEQAIYLALKENFVDQERVVIIVIGAGRAPLVKACFKAAKELNRKVFVYAVEKNPNAIITINSYFAQNRNELKDKLAVVCKDVRDWQPSELADILYSELLGSFADNELSPEILDWSQRLLKQGGLNIPYEYSSFLTPISYPVLHNKLTNSQESKSKLETPFVVKMNRYYSPCDIKKCFTFCHPQSQDHRHDKQFQVLEFKFEQDNTIHGFAGYFEGYLYKGVCISINPDTITKDLYSWFPIYFPFEKAIFVQEGLLLRINVWRLASKRKIWYEWHAEVIDQKTMKLVNSTGIHNSEGRSYRIDL